MHFAIRSEIEYLSAADGNVTDSNTIDEMTRQLEALRRMDQFVCRDDWRPQHNRRVRLPKTDSGRL